MYSSAKRIVVMSGHVDIRVSGGRLKLKYGFPLDGTVTEEWIDRGTCDVDHIVVVGNSGTITLDAIQWLMDMGIVVSMLDYQGNLVTDMLPKEHISPIVKQRQACASPQLQRRLAVWLLQEKLYGQLQTLKGLKFAGFTVGAKLAIKQGIEQFPSFQRALSKCQNADELREVEAQAGKAYWGSFQGVPLSWKVTKAKPVPEHWLTIGPRMSPKSGYGRNSVTPFHSCLNYLYACLESRVKRYCIAYRLDVDFPALHSNSRTNRSGLIYDLMEPVRPLVDRLLYQFMARTALRVSNFFETRQGVCKVMPKSLLKSFHLSVSWTRTLTASSKSSQATSKHDLCKLIPTMTGNP